MWWRFLPKQRLRRGTPERIEEKCWPIWIGAGKIRADHANTMRLDETERSTQIRLMKVKDMMLAQTHQYEDPLH